MNTTHDWSSTVDHAHLSFIREQAAVVAPGGVLHLLHEVLAYVADEAEALGDPSLPCRVALFPDGSVAVRDEGRGTDTRTDERERDVRKPVMATKDLRFFDDPSAQTLPDGTPRRGMSVVAALSDWLVHVNRRRDGAWSQRYVRGIPVTDLEQVQSDGTTGTEVHFLPGQGLASLDVARLEGRGPASR